MNSDKLTSFIGRKCGSKSPKARFFARHDRNLEHPITPDSPRIPGLLEAAVGNAFWTMPAAARDVHGSKPVRNYSGQVIICASQSRFGRAIAWLMGFPVRSEIVPAAFTARRVGDREIWVRQFGTTRFQSILSRKGRRLYESYGPVTCEILITPNPNGFSLSILSTRVFHCPWPSILSPQSHTDNRADETTYRFNISITMPLFGEIVGYQGILDTAFSSEASGGRSAS